MKNNQIFRYDGYSITFVSGEDVMLNATEMARPFEKKPIEWLRLPSTVSYLDTLTKVRKSHLDDFQAVKTVHGGLNPGTWLHEDVAIEFARWLHPEFAIWCNDRIKELMRNGYTHIDTISRKDLALMLLQSEEEKERQQRMINTLTPKAELMERVIDTDSLIDVGQAAKILGLDFGRNTLFRKLREVGVFFKNRNEPRQEYVSRGYFLLKERLIENGSHPFVVMKVLVTQKGLEFLAKRLNVIPIEKSLAMIN